MKQPNRLFRSFCRGLAIRAGRLRILRRRVAEFCIKPIDEAKAQRMPIRRIERIAEPLVNRSAEHGQAFTPGRPASLIA